MKKLLIVLLISCISLFAQQAKYVNINQDFTNSSFELSKTKIVVKFTDNFLLLLDKSKLISGKTGIQEFDQLLDELNVNRIKEQFPNAKEKVYRGRTIKLANWYKFFFKNEVDVNSVIETLSNVNGIQEVQPIGIHSVIKTSNDPKRPDQWHLDQANDHDIDIEDAWDIETGNTDIIVAIFDTGVRYFHKDLGGADASYNNPELSDGNMWINSGDNNNNGIDDDGNGYVDDWIGWDFVENESVPSGEDGNTPDNDPRDYNGHGTHCAGIVGAINNNGYAVSSPAGGWNNGTQTTSGNGVKIMACRIGYTSGPAQLNLGFVGMEYAAEAFYYAANNGAKIVSCSWGSSNTGGIDEAIDYFLASGGLIFKAAGNADNEESDYMLDRDDIIGVASTDQNDVKSSFSTYGTFVDISAPGTDIMSTYHKYDDPENDYVASVSGTSMATPLAAGVTSLIWSKYPTWTAQQVKQRLFDTVDDIESIPGNSAYIGKLGVGRINAHQALIDLNIAVDVKIFLQGAYNNPTSMNTTINSSIPLTSPYSEDPVTVTAIPTDVVDWVLVQLKETANGAVVNSKSAFLRNDGVLLDQLTGSEKVDMSAASGNYFIVIKHRNHLPIMSASAVSLPNNTIYDFTTGSDKYYGGDAGAIKLD